VPHGDGWEHDPFGAEVAGGSLYGLGSVDAKGPLAAFVSAIEALVSARARLRGDLILAAVVDEEASSSGARALVRSLRADCALVGEPTGMRVATAHRGSFRPVVVVRGRTSHSSRPEQGVNAAFQALPVLEALRAYAGAVAGAHPLCGTPTATVTMLTAGIKDNVIPDRCEITIDRRLIPGETDASAEAEIEALLAEAKLRNPGLQAGIERHLATTGPPSELDRAHPLVAAARRAADLVGESGELIGLSGACDMTHFIGAGIPALVMGPGDGSLAHQPDEHMDLGQLHRGAIAYALVGAAVCGLEDAA
jgi:succinyl-diaminopimelate desuccinylase